MPTAKEKLEGSKEDFENDVEELREVAKNEEWNLIRKIKYTAKQESNKLILIGVIATFAYFTFFSDFVIPEWAYLVTLSAIVSGVVVMPFANKIAKMFIKDNRVPLLELPNEGFELYKVPRNRIGDIELTQGSVHETQTAKGKNRALELRKFEKIEENGKSKLVGLGNWESIYPNSDIKRTWENVVAMRETLVPQARKAREYDMKMPYWIHQMENDTINNLIYQFEEGATFEGADMHKKIKNDMGIDDELGEKDEETTIDREMKIEELNENLEQMSKMMDNGGDN